MTRASKIRLLRDTGIISHDPAGECSLHYRNVSKSPRATRGPLYQRGLLGPLLYQRRDREDFASSIATLALLPLAAMLRALQQAKHGFARRRREHPASPPALQPRPVDTLLQAARAGRSTNPRHEPLV